MPHTALRILAATALTATALTGAGLTVATPVGAVGLRTPMSTDASPDTGPCGPVGRFRPSGWFRTTTSPLIAPAIQKAAASEHWQWRDDTNTLWRGDTRDTVRQLFEDGFTPRGETVTPLAEYIVKGGGQNTAHVSTSCERWVAQKFATYGAARTGWVYEIEAPGGIDVNATARVNGYKSPYLWNKEIDFPGGIQGNHIKKACKYRLVKTDPATKVNSYENLGCQINRHYELAVTATH